MKISPEEQQAIKDVVAIGKRFGFGNMIQHLRTGWVRLLVDQGLDLKTAKHGAGGCGYPLAMQDDMMERGEWDETGGRYV